MNKPYGKEVILDIHECDIEKLTRKGIRKFFEDLCDLLDMEACDLHFWDYEGEEEEYEKAPDHLKGISAIQFISTSNITIHTLDKLKRVYLNVFSCKDFVSEDVARFAIEYFGGTIMQSETMDRI